MKVKIVLIIIFFLSLSSSRAFDHILHLEKKIFYPHEFNFNVIRVIDARISKEEPIGFVKNGIRAKIVGNIDLEKDMTSFVLDSVFFRKQNPIILVVNQVNFRPMPGEQGFVICFDYYKADGDSVSLIFSQTSRFTHESTTNSGNGINKTYSKAIEQAFLDFKNHLYFYKPFPSKTIHIKDLEKSFTVVNKKVSASLSEGLYFNIIQVLNNTPAKTNYLFNDSALTKHIPLVFPTSSYNIKMCYAIVNKGKLYFYLYNNIYYPSTFSEGQLYLSKAYEPQDSRASTRIYYNHGTALDLAIELFFSLLNRSNNFSKFKDIVINQQTGQLTL